MERYATFSNASYELYDPLSSKINNQKKSLKVLEDAGIDGYRIDNSSSDKRGVYVNDKKKDIVIAHRGTIPSSSANIQSDIMIGLGFQNTTERFKRAVRNDKKVKNKYPDYNITITGHSLGSQIGYNSATKNNLKGEFFNMGSNITPYKSLTNKFRKTNNNITHYSTMLDPISLGAKTEPIKQVIIKRKKNTNPHSLSNFI